MLRRLALVVLIACVLPGVARAVPIAMPPVRVMPTSGPYVEPGLALTITLRSADTDEGPAIFRVESAVDVWWLGQQGYLLLDVLATSALQGGVGVILTPNPNVALSLVCGTEGCRNGLRIIPGAPDPGFGGVDVTVPAALPGSELRVTYQLDGGAIGIVTRAIVPEPGTAALLGLGLVVLGVRRSSRRPLDQVHTAVGDRTEWPPATT